MFKNEIHCKFFPLTTKDEGLTQREVVKYSMLHSYNGTLYYKEWEITIKANNEKSPITVKWNTRVAGQDKIPHHLNSYYMFTHPVIQKYLLTYTLSSFQE